MIYYTVEQINDIPKEVLEVPYAYTLASKNIYNSSMHIIRQIIASYDRVLINSKEIDDFKKKQLEIKLTNKKSKKSENNINIKKEIQLADKIKPIYGYRLKQNLHTDSRQALDLVNIVINQLNTKNTNHFNKQMKKYDEVLKVKKEKILKSPKLKLYGLYTDKITSTDFYQYLDTNLIINTIKLKELSGKYKDYLEVSTHIANTAVDKVILDYKNFNKAITVYHKSPGKFLGKPKSPNYKEQLSRSEYRLDKNRITKEGILARVITRDNIKTFTSIKNKENVNQLYTNHKKEELINNDFIDSYNDFSFIAIIDNTVKSVQGRIDKELSKYNNLPPNKNNIKITSSVEFSGFNFIPNDKFELIGKPKVIVQAVLKHTVNLPQDNFFYKILKINNKFLELSDKDKIKFIQENFKYAFNDYGVSSIDPGVFNHASMTFNNVNNVKLNKSFKNNRDTVNKKFKDTNLSNNGNILNPNTKSINLNNLLKGLLFAGDKYNNYVRNKELELDKIKSSLIPSSIKLIQSKIDNAKNELVKQKLNTLQELIDNYNDENKKFKDYAFLSIEEVLGNEINMQHFEKEFDSKVKLLPKIEISKTDSDLVKFANINIYKNPEYVLKLQKLNNYKANYLHKMSSSIIDICNYNNINILIFGKNDNWKNKSNIGKLNNRNQGSFAHTKLIDLLKYKALMFGITVLITEESNTSKTSFVNNSVLKVYKKYEKIKPNPVQNGFKYKVKKEIIKNKELNNNVEQTFDNDKNINAHKNIKQKLASEPILETISNTKNNDDNGIAKHSFGGVRRTRGIFINDNINTKNIKIVDNENNGKNISLKTKKAKDKNLVVLPRLSGYCVHADINASFNIMRKIFPKLEYSSDKYSLNYRVASVQLNKKYVKLIT